MEINDFQNCTFLCRTCAYICDISHFLNNLVQESTQIFHHRFPSDSSYVDCNKSPVAMYSQSVQSVSHPNKGQVIRATFSFNLSRNIVALQVEQRCCPYYHRVLSLPRNKCQCCKLKNFVAKSRIRVYFAQHIAVTCNTEICCVAS